MARPTDSNSSPLQLEWPPDEYRDSPHDRRGRRARSDPRGVRDGRREARRSCSQPGRARDVQPAVVGALLLQALQEAPHDASDRRPCGLHGPGGERGRGRRRRRLGGCLQSRVAQPPERGRAVPGCGHRSRRNPARHLRARRPADRGARLTAVRRADQRALALPARRRCRRHRALRQLDRRAEHRWRGLLRGAVRDELSGQRDGARPRTPEGHGAQRGCRYRQRARAVRCINRARRNRRRVGARLGRARRQ